MALEKVQNHYAKYCRKQKTIQFTHIAYVVFTVIFTYVVLQRMDPNPCWQEYYVILYILSAGCEKIREITSSEPDAVSHKFSVWAYNIWNPCDAAAIIVFIVGLSMRLTPSTMNIGRVIYCLNIVYWYVRVLNILSVNKSLGPLLTMFSKMLKSTSYFVILLLLMVLSFGICRQAIMNPDNDFEWTYVKNAIFHPYFMMFGEVFDSEIDPDCGDGDGQVKCVTGHWISPLAQALYLLVTNFLLVNLLIAVFNNIFYELNAISHQIWMFQRFKVVMEYEQKPILPPPLIVLSHIFLLLKYSIRKMRGIREPYDNAFKLFLGRDDLERLYDFGEECVDGYCREQEAKLNMSSDERIKNTAERVDNVYQKVEDINQKETRQMSNMQTVEFRIRKLEDLTLEHLSVVHSFISTYTKDRQISAALTELTSKKRRKMLSKEKCDDEPRKYPDRKRHVSLEKVYPSRRRPTRSLTEFRREFVTDESSPLSLYEAGGRDSTKPLKENTYTFCEEKEEAEKERDGEEATVGESATGITIDEVINGPGKKQSGSETSVANSCTNHADAAEETKSSLDLSLLDFLERNSLDFWSHGRKCANMRKCSVDMGCSNSLPHSPRRQRSETYSGPDNITEDEETAEEGDLPNTEQAERNLAWAESRLKLKPHMRNSQLMLPSVQSEYTSITDELETVCGLLNTSRSPRLFTPRGSPIQTRRDRHHSEMSNPEMAVYLEKEHLRDAEDNDYQLMERLIQRHYEDESTDNAFYFGGNDSPEIRNQGRSLRRESAVEMPSPTGGQAQQGPAIFCTDTDTDTQQLKLLRTFQQPDKADKPTSSVKH